MRTKNGRSLCKASVRQPECMRRAPAPSSPRNSADQQLAQLRADDVEDNYCANPWYRIVKRAQDPALIGCCCDRRAPGDAEGHAA